VRLPWKTQGPLGFRSAVELVTNNLRAEHVVLLARAEVWPFEILLLERAAIPWRAGPTVVAWPRIFALPRRRTSLSAVVLPSVVRWPWACRRRMDRHADHEKPSGVFVHRQRFILKPVVFVLTAGSHELGCEQVEHSECLVATPGNVVPCVTVVAGGKPTHSGDAPANFPFLVASKPLDLAVQAGQIAARLGVIEPSPALTTTGVALAAARDSELLWMSSWRWHFDAQLPLRRAGGVLVERSHARLSCVADRESPNSCSA